MAISISRRSALKTLTFGGIGLVFGCRSDKNRPSKSSMPPAGIIEVNPGHLQWPYHKIAVTSNAIFLLQYIGDNFYWSAETGFANIGTTISPLSVRNLSDVSQPNRFRSTHDPKVKSDVLFLLNEGERWYNIPDNASDDRANQIRAVKEFLQNMPE